MKEILLPQPIPMEEPLSSVIARRRSRRKWAKKPVELEKLATILWAVQGITDKRHEFRAVPSAGATYPLEVYVVVENVTGLDKAIYHYNPYNHSLEVVKTGSYGASLEKACLGQEWVGRAPFNIVLTAVFFRTTRYYGERGVMYVYLEAGHAGQNIYLAAEALGLGTVAIGAFYDEMVSEILGLTGSEKPVYIFPVGYPV